MTIDPALLEPGERLIWSGRPNPLRYMQARSGINIMIGLAALIFAEVWISAAVRDGNPMAWIGSVFFVMAIALLLSPLWQAWRARQTVYALTDRRVLTTIGGPFPRRISVPLTQVHSVELRPRRGTLGDVLLREIVLRGADNSVAGRDGFIAIPDAAKVERLVLSALPPAAKA